MSPSDIRAPEAPGRSAVDLATLREEIDRIDESLLELLAERYRTVEEVSRLKSLAGMMPLDPPREAEIVRRAAEAGRARGVPEEEVRSVFWSVLALCRGSGSR